MFLHQSLSALLLFSTFSLAVGQTSNQEVMRDGRRLPNELELKSNYCIAVIRGFIANNLKFERDFETQLQSITDQSELKMLTDAVAKSRRDSDVLRNGLNRLESYVLPRRPYLDLSAMSAAYDRGRVDFVRHLNDPVRDQCWAKCAENRKIPENEQVTCFKNCDLVDPTTNRVLDCRRVNFLPY